MKPQEALALAERAIRRGLRRGMDARPLVTSEAEAGEEAIATLRALPVLTSCSDCSHCASTDDDRAQCLLADVDHDEPCRFLPDEDVIPDWCPLRGAL